MTDEVQNVTYLQGQVGRTEDPPRDNLLNILWVLLFIVVVAALCVAPAVVIYTWRTLL